MSSSVARYFPRLVTDAATSDLPGETSASRGNSENRNEARFDELTDEVLIARICTKDQDALACLFRRYARLVRSVSLRLLADASEAEDLLQDIFLFIHHKAAIFDAAKSSARSWIVQMTYHRAIDRRRELQARHFYSQVALSGRVEEMDPRADGANTPIALKDLVGNTTIEGLFDTLTDDQRNTLCLHFYEGYTFGEIAEKLDQPLGNIRHHYYRGLDKLRQQIFKSKTPGRNGRYPK